MPDFLFVTLAVTWQAEFLEDEPVLARSIKLRSSYVDAFKEKGKLSGSSR